MDLSALERLFFSSSQSADASFVANYAKNRELSI